MAMGGRRTDSGGLENKAAAVSPGWLGGLAWSSRPQMSARDAVVPAEGILIEKAPEIAECGGKGGKKRGQYAPTTQTAMDGRAIEIRELEASGAESGSGTGVDDKQELVRHPEQHGDDGGGPGEERKRSANGIEAQKDCAKGGQSGSEDEAVECGRKQPAGDGCRLNLRFGAGARVVDVLDRLDEDSTERGRRRHDLGRFDDARTIENRIGEQAGMKGGDCRGTGKFDDLGGWFGFWLRRCGWMFGRVHRGRCEEACFPGASV